MMSNRRVELTQEDGRVGFMVEFKGPAGTAYEGGTWVVRVELPGEYPFRSPSIGFTNRIFHPNVDEASGSVCLDVINQTWSPMFNLVNVFDQFLPQLLTYPNPADPLNGEAAALMMRDSAAFERKVRDYVAKYASSSSSSSSSGAATTMTGTPELVPGSLSSAGGMSAAASPTAGGVGVERKTTTSSGTNSNSTSRSGGGGSGSGTAEDDDDAMSVLSRGPDEEGEDLLGDMDL